MIRHIVLFSARDPAELPLIRAALARLATWRDLGAGAGPLLAGMLLPVLPAPMLYGGAAVCLGAAALGLVSRRARSGD